MQFVSSCKISLSVNCTKIRFCLNYKFHWYSVVMTNWTDSVPFRFLIHIPYCKYWTVSFQFPFTYNFLLVLIPVPGSPTNFEVAILSSTSVSLSWSPPRPDQQNGAILRYIINVTLITSQGTTDIQPMMFETTGLSHTVNSLHPHWTYQFEVAAETSAGASTFSVQIGTLMEDGNQLDDVWMNYTPLCTIVNLKSICILQNSTLRFMYI